MNEKDFEARFSEILDEINRLVIVKGKEYRRNNNPFHNFEKGALLNNSTPELELTGYLSKHMVSYFDIINDIKNGDPINISQVQEKFGDIRIYLILLQIMLENNAKITKKTV